LAAFSLRPVDHAKGSPGASLFLEEIMKQLREQLQCYGSETLSDVELLTLVLCTGPAHDDLSTVIPALLANYGGLGGLMRAALGELCQEHRLSTAKAAQLQAVLELAKRLSIERPDRKYQIRSVDDAANLVRLELMYLDHEEMHLLILDTKHQVVEHLKRYKGTVNSSVLRASEVFRPAVVRNCPNVIVCHNHPSGDPTPSPEDIGVTKQLVSAGRLLDIDLLDHIIIGNPRYVSLKERLRW
jgi:DNA repair protein RadC